MALADHLSDSVVATVIAVAGDNQVSYSAEPLKGLRLSAHGDTEPGEFGETASDQGGFRIVTETEAIGNSAGDGEHILRGGTAFDTHEIGRRVGAKPRSVERVLQALSSVRVLASDDGGCGHLARHFLGMIRP